MTRTLDPNPNPNPHPHPHLAQVRRAVRGLLHALVEEEERRAAVEATLELSAKEGESVWRAELLGLYRETAARVRSLAHAQAGRYEQLEALVERTS